MNFQKTLGNPSYLEFTPASTNSCYRQQLGASWLRKLMFARGVLFLIKLILTQAWNKGLDLSQESAKEQAHPMIANH